MQGSSGNEFDHARKVDHADRGGVHQGHGGLWQKIFPVVPGDEYIVFFSGDPADLPSDDVGREVVTEAWRIRVKSTRNALEIIVGVAGSGVIGNAAWAALTHGIVAARRYWEKRNSRLDKIDAAAAISRVLALCPIFLGDVPPTLGNAECERDDSDGSWRIHFTHRAVEVDVHLDAAGEVAHWKQQKPRKSGKAAS